MEHFTTFHGKCVSIDLARVLAFERHHAHGIAEILGQRRRMRVTLSDGSDVYVEEDEDTESFIAAIDTYLATQTL
jgi:hypothetical protein